MKKWLIVLGLAALIGGVWYVVRTKIRYTPVWFQPKFGTVTRGDISVPVTAAGLIEPNLRIEVKAKASGEVIEVPVTEGTFVHKGDKLLVLKKDDEQRRYDAAKADVDRAKAMLEQAKVGVSKAEANIITAEAEVERLAAEVEVSAEDLRHAEINHENRVETSQGLITMRGRHTVNLALKKAAEARLTIAYAALKEAEEAVKLQEAALRVAESSFGDAKQRLDETTLIAQYDAIVTEVRVKMSEVIQGGMNTLTGGTPVMYLAEVSRKKVVARLDESDYGSVLKISPIDALPEMPGLKEAAAATAMELERRSGTVKLTVDAFPEESFTGVIERVEPQGKLNAGSAVIQYDVHVAITDPNAHKLPLGAQAQVEFTVQSAKDALLVPAEAVKSHPNQIDQRGVYVEQPPEPGSNEQWGKKFIPCRVGIIDGQHAQILEVLDGEKIEVGQRVFTKLPASTEKAES